MSFSTCNLTFFDESSTTGLSDAFRFLVLLLSFCCNSKSEECEIRDKREGVCERVGERVRSVKVRNVRGEEFERRECECEGK